jgi:hypothetical protein
MKLNKKFCYDKILPIIITAFLSAMISIFTNILAQYTGVEALRTNPESVGVIGLALKTAHVLKSC